MPGLFGHCRSMYAATASTGMRRSRPMWMDSTWPSASSSWSKLRPVPSCWAASETVSSKLWPTTSCGASGLPDTEPLDAHLNALLDRVQHKHHELRELSDEDYRLDWFCFIDGDNGQLGLVLPHLLVSRLAALPIDLDLDIYA
jgi:hypothetical protein